MLLGLVGTPPFDCQANNWPWKKQEVPCSSLDGIGSWGPEGTALAVPHQLMFVPLAKVLSSPQHRTRPPGKRKNKAAAKRQEVQERKKKRVLLKPQTLG